MSRAKLIAIAVAGAVLVFLVGFVPEWLRGNRLQDELGNTRFELQTARLEGRLGAALAESLRSNYERARQLMTGFFTELDRVIPRVEDPGRRRELQAIQAQRDEIITLLARADPESTQRLMLLYTRYFASMDPLGRESPTALTPSPPAPDSTADTAR